MITALLIVTALVAFITMEGVAWFTHKYIMHGFLWRLHKDHHKPASKRSGFLEKNDWFFVIFAFPAMVLYIMGSIFANPYLFAFAIGISLYGMAYFVFHEVVFHRRLKWFRKWKSNYVQAVRRAHAAHHKHIDRHHGECFGLLLFPAKYFTAENKPT